MTKNIRLKTKLFEISLIKKTSEIRQKHIGYYRLIGWHNFQFYFKNKVLMINIRRFINN